ncbi:hypothetical protein Ctob_012499 [Chrysochromulina tobinii]|uniref:AB hydrolase-1 domain-containing protein n=1 Tax=Chrysochromulina tobinii TaxID=1460289 RepID=A0A0M0JTV8_9EUKA|nr:hypothetical protein Ctob_012499 [Chrysochromulina tobinii]|eukprot:KOO30126.1 hypothetical protein Ctob_012499 [Chrysochromulina sp. CCMP291]
MPRAALPRRRDLLCGSAAAAAAALLPPDRAAAWCGEPVPSWAFYLQWDQTALPFEYQGASAQVRYRVVGDIVRERKAGVPPVVVIGTPGFGYDYLETLEALTVSDRRVAMVILAGTAAGEDLPPVLRTADACAEQIRAVCRALKPAALGGKPAVHLVAHGLGAVPALRVLASSAADAIGVRSLTLISPWGALSDLRDEARAAISAATDIPGPQLMSALLPTVEARARASCIAEAAAGGGGPLLLAPSLYMDASAALAGPALAERLAAAQPTAASGAISAGRIPVLLATGGDKDLVDASRWSELPSTVTRATFAGSAHLPFVDESESFLYMLVDFLDKADGTSTNRELKFGDPIETIKEIMKKS